ncbi:MAG: MarC family NAAT transporter [Chthoniobacterales bacterium]
MNLQQLTAYFLGALASLLAIVNPPIAVPLFVALSAKLSPKKRAKRASSVALNVAIILLCVLVFGSLILRIFGISLGAVRVARGLIIAFLGFRMLFPARSHDHDPRDKNLEPTAEESDYTFVPLALPTLAGPGSMAVVIGYSTLIQQGHSIPEQIAEYVLTAGTILVVALAVWIVLRSSNLIAQRLGDHGLTALSRVIGFLMVCIGIQFIPSGVHQLLKTLNPLGFPVYPR